MSLKKLLLIVFTIFLVAASCSDHISGPFPKLPSAFKNDILLMNASPNKLVADATIEFQIEFTSLYDGTVSLAFGPLGSASVLLTNPSTDTLGINANGPHIRSVKVEANKKKELNLIIKIIEVKPIKFQSSINLDSVYVDGQSYVPNSEEGLEAIGRFLNTNLTTTLLLE